MYSQSRHRGTARGEYTNVHKGLAVLAGIIVGYLFGYVLMETADTIFGSGSSIGVVPITTGTSTDILSKATSGSADLARKVIAEVKSASRPAGDTIHSILTSNGSPYQNFQGRIMYGTYKLVQKMPGGEKLTGFTRILHRMTEDSAFHEIPTFRATPLHPECDTWCDFPVADRPDAVRQWIDAVGRDPSMMKGAWVLVLECDYVWMKPVQAPDAYNPESAGLQFFFDYIQPNHPDCAHIIKRLAGGMDPALVPASGPAPAMMRFTDLQKVVPEWIKVTAAIEADKEAVKVLDWVREMYAWDIAIVKNNVKMLTQMPPNSQLIAQPPHDLSIGAAAMFHYTWGALYNENGKEFWRWEKRDYTAPEKALKVPHIPLPPSWHEGIKLQDGLPVSQQLHNTLVDMLTQMNRAIDGLPDLSPTHK